MALTPLAFGTTADPISAITGVQSAALLSCGPLDIGLLNGLLKLLADQIDAVDAADNAIVSAGYNSTTNVLTFAMADGPPVDVPLTPVIADAVATGLITTSSYNAATNMLTLTTANGDMINIDLTAVVADAITGAIMPVGGIIMWSGSIAAIPSGWHLCDGTAGTPDLRDRFVVGAGSTYAVAANGGSASHNHGGATNAGGGHDHGAATGGHALTVQQMPEHSHGNGVGDQLTTSMVYGTQPASTSTNMNNDASAGTLEGLTSSVGGGEQHSHSITAAPNHTHGLDAASSLPPYLALAYIMKI